MLERTHGLVLRTRLLTETSLIVHWLTPDLGRVATVAKGARRAPSPFRGKLDLFYLDEISFSRSRRSDLHLLREAMVRETPGALRENLDRLRQASYAAALIEQSTETDTPLPGVFDLALGLVRHLSMQPARPLSVFAFEFRILTLLGLKPDLAPAALSPGARQVLAKLADLDWDTLPHLKPSAAQVREIGRYLDGFLVYHLGKVPKGREAAVGKGP